MTTPVGCCGQCNQTLPADTVSLYFCDIVCQSNWYLARLMEAASIKTAAPAPPGSGRAA